MLTALDRAIVAVEDLESATRDYRQLLGRKPTYHGESIRGEGGEAGGARTACFRLASTSLELRSDTPDEGLCALSFETEDLAACAAWLRGRGIDLLGPLPGASTDERTGAIRRWKTALISPALSRGIRIGVRCEDPDSDPPPPASGCVDPREAVHDLDHVVISTSDGEAARSFYGDALGLRLALDRSFEERGIRILFFRVGGVTIEVVAALEGGREAEAASSGKLPPDRFGGLAWQVGDVRAIHARLGRQGFDLSEQRAGHKPGTRVCTVRAKTHAVPTLLIGADLG